MSDDLVQRLGDTGPDGGVGAGLSLCREAADRIEALEARNRALEEALRSAPHDFVSGYHVCDCYKAALDA